jgi:hypothetical protein
MIDSFPANEWSEEVAAYFTWGPGSSTGTYILTVLGIIVMIAAFIGWVWVENRKLWAQTDLLRAAGGMPAPGGIPPGGPAPSQPPLAGPSVEPGE